MRKHTARKGRMKKLFILTFGILLLLASNSFAATYYVRSGGGTSTQCTGLANADYDGAGSGEACAYNHPRWWTGWCGDYPNSCTNGSIAGGDDLIVVNGTYNVGYSSEYTNCNASWSYGCNMKDVVDGTSGNHTTIKGCTSTGCADDNDRPGFYGTGRNYHGLSLKNSDYVDVQDINIYDTGTCGLGHATMGCGSADAAELTLRDGINVTGSSNITLTDMNIHGAYRYGVFGGSVNTITFDNVDVSYNSFGGWDGDSCGGAGTCGLSGTMTFQNGFRMIYNGCIETNVYGTIASNGCYSQDQSGYGDALGFGNTGGNWIFNDVNISHNVSDGIDLLYLNRGAYSGGSVTIKRSLFEGNAGNNVKVPNNMKFEDSFNIANCAYFAGQSFTCSSGTCGSSFNNCRANGNAFSIEFKSGDNATPRISSSTILTNSDVMLLTTGTCTAGTDVFFSNNVVLGGTEYNDGSDLTSIYYEDGGTCNPDFIENNNICYNLKEGTNACNGTNSIDGTGVPSTLFTGTLTQGPGSYYSSANYVDQLTLHASSVARGVSDETFTGADAVDYNSYDRGAAWDAGAYEYGTAGGGAVCGNGSIEAPEECDDSNTTSGDGCTSGCLDEYCGDGTVNDNGAEQCDDGGTTAGDGCSATCQNEASPPATPPNSAVMSGSISYSGSILIRGN